MSYSEIRARMFQIETESTQPRYVVNEESNIFFFRPDSQVRAEITPKQFFCLVSRQIDRTVRVEDFPKEVDYFESSEIAVTKRMREQLPLDPTFFDIEVEDRRIGKVVEHEGRHRAFVAHKLGIEKVPVVFFIRKGGDLVSIQSLTREEKGTFNVALILCDISGVILK